MTTGVPDSTQSKAVVSTQTTLVTPFDDLPQELIFKILSHVTHLNQLHSLLLTNKSLKVLVEGHPPLWDDWLKKQFPYSSKEAI